MQPILLTAVLLFTSVLGLAQANSAPPPDAASDTTFSLAVAERVLDEFRTGITGHNARRALASFDPQTPGYSQLADALGLLFDRYDQLRVYSRITQVNADGERGVATAEFTLEATPRDDSQPRLRRSTELRLTFARQGTEWKVIDLHPRDFLAKF